MTDSQPIASARDHARYVSLESVQTRLLNGLRKDAVMGTGLYALAVLVLVSPLGNHPSFPYNWEPYAAWNVFAFWIDEFRLAQVFALTDGLMTDSGRGPLIGLPVWLGFWLSGAGIDAMRLPVTLLAAGAAPLLWLVGRRLVGSPAALLAALLFALSPAWLLYGRTATLVGVSLVPALLTVYVLLGVLEGRRRQIAWLIALQVLLVAGAYAYAPIRFLWPLGLGLIAIETVRGPNRRRPLAALAVTALVLPTALAGIDRATTPDSTVFDGLANYYTGRGEHIFALNEDPDRYAFYLDSDSDTETHAEAGQLARQLVRQNSGDLARILLDYDTAAAVTHFWNPGGEPVGRLYPAAFVPFLAVGVVASGWGLVARRRREDLVLLSMAAGFSLPMLLTSHVHIGRLIFALPFLCLLTAAGAWETGRLPGGWLTRIPSPIRRLPALPQMAKMAVALVLAGAVASSALAEEDVALPDSPAVRIVAALKARESRVEETGGALVMGDTADTVFETVSVAEFRLYLDDTYRFIDPGEGTPNGQATGTGELPALYYGGLLDRLTSEQLPDFCSLTFFVVPQAEPRYLDAIETVPDDCAGPNQHILLPA